MGVSYPSSKSKIHVRNSHVHQSRSLTKENSRYSMKNLYKTHSKSYMNSHRKSESLSYLYTNPKKLVFSIEQTLDKISISQIGGSANFMNSWTNGFDWKNDSRNLENEQNVELIVSNDRETLDSWFLKILTYFWNCMYPIQIIHFENLHNFILTNKSCYQG